MSEIKNVSGTAFVVAEFRAEENNEAKPLYRDSVVALFLNEETRSAAGRVAASFPSVKDLVKIRTKYFDDMLDKQIVSRWPTYLIWEGNTMYLPLASTKDIITQLRTHLKRFWLSFDYMAEAVVAKTTGDPGITRLVESLANMGAPWLSGIHDIQGLADELRLRVVENFKTAELYRDYWLGRLMTSPIFTFYSVCTLAFSTSIA